MMSEESGGRQEQRPMEIEANLEEGGTQVEAGHCKGAVRPHMPPFTFGRVDSPAGTYQRTIVQSLAQNPQTPRHANLQL